MNNLSPIDISPDQYQAFQQFLQAACGIVLSDNKQYLIKNRLQKLFQEYDIHSFDELLRILEENSVNSKHIRTRVIDCMTTNETFWFRDEFQFLELQNKILPDLIKNKAGSLRIWSAACSSGQEPYSISICIQNALDNIFEISEKSINIIATDISDKTLEQAKNALYSNLEISRGLDEALKKQCFDCSHEGYRLKPDIAQRVRFQQFNLLKSFSVLGRFDIIFCRNVLIYFSDAAKHDLLIRMGQILESHGYLFLSSTESMPTDIQDFTSISSGNTRYYQKK